MTDIPALLEEARRALTQAGVPFATIGGCARNAYAEPRATKDVDFVVAADDEAYGSLQRSLSARGFSRATMVREEGDVVPDFEAFRDEGGRRIDILFAKTDFERSALARAEQQAPYVGVTLPVVTPEDLVVYKLIAGRTQDWADLEAVLRTLALGARSIDWPYVERWCAQWDATDRLAELRRRVGAS